MSAVVFQAAALCLAYPDQELLDRLDLIEAALAGTRSAERFAPVLDHLRPKPLVELHPKPLVELHPKPLVELHPKPLVELHPKPLVELHPKPLVELVETPHLQALQSFHVQEFDLSRRHALHLSYWTDGDTRRRGEVLAEIKGVYRDSGLVVDLSGELPDYLPIMLEFAVADPERGRGLLQRFRASLELLRIGLTEDHLPHAAVVAAICDCLPGESPKTRIEVQAMVDEVAPLELVGLHEVTRR